MAVCDYYLRDQCKFGDRCRFEHPGSARDGGRGVSSGFAPNSNRFGALNGGGDRYRPGQQSGSTFGSGRTDRFGLSKDDIKADLTDQRPLYPLSCYGPGKNAPRQLIEGSVEISPEEMRLRYYTCRAEGNEATAQAEETRLSTEMKEQVERILKDLDGAIKYVEDGADVHPNRHDVRDGKAQVGDITRTSPAANPLGKAPVSALGSGMQTQTPAFGQPSAPAFGQSRSSVFGQPSNPQATSAFGQPSNPAQSTSGFGQTSSLGGGSGSAFGKPALPSGGAFGQPSSLGSAFGKPSGLGSGSAFGKPSLPGATSAFGQPSVPVATSAFGQSSAPGATSAFGQPSAPGATSAFGKPSLPGQPSAFSQSNALGQNTAFGKPAFGTSTFGQASQPSTAAVPFGQQAKQSSPFSQQQPQINQPSPFSQQQPQANNQPSAFGQQQQPQAKPNPFGSPAAVQTPAFGTTGFGKPSPSPFGATQAPVQQQPAASSNPFTQNQQASATPSTFSQAQPAASALVQQPPARPQPVAGSGKPVDAKERLKEGKPEEYEGEQGKVLEEIYRRVGQLGRFNDDEPVPLVPPKCEWIVPVQ